MATKNDITGDSLISKVNSETYRNNYDLIFGKGKKNEQRTGLHDGAMEQSDRNSGEEHQGESRATVAEETDYSHDRTPTSSEH